MLLRPCLILIAISHMSLCLADNTRPATEDADTVSFWLDRLPEDSETLLVVQSEYTIPLSAGGKLSKPGSLHEIHLGRIFGERSRRCLSGKTINCSIESASDFRSPEWPLEILNASITGWTPKYDGCHILIFQKDSAPVWEDLVTAIREDPQTSSVVHGRILVFEPRHHLFHRHRLANETPDLAEKIDRALTSRFWMTAYSPNVFIISTNDRILAKLSQSSPTVHDAPFPRTLALWNSIDRSLPVWGIRHARHFSSFFGQETPDSEATQKATGISFSIDPRSRKFQITFQTDNPASCERWRSLVQAHFDSSAAFVCVREEGYRASLNTDSNFESIAFLIMCIMGHVAMI